MRAAAAPGSVLEPITGRGEPDLVLARWTDQLDLGICAEIVLQAQGRFGAIRSPIFFGIADFDAAVLNIEVDRLVRLAGDEQAINPRIPQLGTEKAAYV